MRRLNLNYQQLPDRPRKLAGWLLLIVGVVLLIEMGVSYNRLQNDREAMNNEIRTSKLHLDTGKKSTSHQFAQKDIEEARQIMNRLSTPWDSFFTGLESLNNKNVAILSIKPDMQTGRLRIEGEAKDYAAVLTFVAQLGTTKPFADVFLLRHEIKREDPGHPVGFTLSIRWVKSS